MASCAKAHLGLKAHIKHAVCLIQSQKGGPLHAAGLHLQQVNQPPRRAHSHLHSLPAFVLDIIDEHLHDESHNGVQLHNFLASESSAIPEQPLGRSRGSGV